MANSALKVEVQSVTGKKAGSVTLPSELFDINPNIPLIHQVVVAQRAAARQGTHSTKRRGEVSGSGRKPFRQKGTGNSRQGSIRAPEHTGGGIVHGPKPRNYAQRTPKKMVNGALLGVLSDRARGQRLHIIESFGFDEDPSTKSAVAALKKLDATQNVLVVLGRGEEITLKSVRNIPFVHVLYFDQLNAYDVVVSDDVVFTQDAYDAFVAAKTGAPVAKKTADEEKSE